MKIYWKTILILICLCFLLGWDLGLLISLDYYKNKYYEQKEFIQKIEENIDPIILNKIRREARCKAPESEVAAWQEKEIKNLGCQRVYYLNQKRF